MSTPSDDKTDNSDVNSDRLQRAREAEGLTKKKAAEILGVGYSTYRGWEKGRNAPEAGIEMVVQSLRKGDKLASRKRQPGGTGDPIYDLSSPGQGAEVLRGEPSGYMPESHSLSGSGRDVFWIPVSGDAMDGQYPKGALVPVAKLKEPATDISADDVYLVSWEGAVQIKRLQRLSGNRMRVISSSSAYPDQVIDLSEEESTEVDRLENTSLQVLGRVLV
jgi:phage repressor protein C with HTH and peptisase S24 domain